MRVRKHERACALLCEITQDGGHEGIKQTKCTQEVRFLINSIHDFALNFSFAALFQGIFDVKLSIHLFIPGQFNTYLVEVTLIQITEQVSSFLRSYTTRCLILVDSVG